MWVFVLPRAPFLGPACCEPALRLLPSTDCTSNTTAPQASRGTRGLGRTRFVWRMPPVVHRRPRRREQPRGSMGRANRRGRVVKISAAAPLCIGPVPSARSKSCPIALNARRSDRGATLGPKARATPRVRLRGSPSRQPQWTHQGCRRAVDTRSAQPHEARQRPTRQRLSEPDQGPWAAAPRTPRCTPSPGK